MQFVVSYCPSLWFVDHRWWWPIFPILIFGLQDANKRNAITKWTQTTHKDTQVVCLSISQFCVNFHFPIGTPSLRWYHFFDTKWFDRSQSNREKREKWARAFLEAKFTFFHLDSTVIKRNCFKHNSTIYNNDNFKVLKGKWMIRIGFDQKCEC